MDITLTYSANDVQSFITVFYPAQMVACLPLVQQVRVSIPGGVVNFHLKIFNLGARRGGNVHFLIARLYITVLDQIPNPSAVCMLRRHIVLLIVIRPSDGDVKPGGHLGAFREEQAISRHWVSPSPFLSSSSSRTTQLHYTNSYTYSHPNLNFLQYTIQILVPHIMWSAQAVHDSKIDHTQCHLSTLSGT